ncbi:hypothetical protein V1281_002596 [Nitrobacteraceae bacterium AZCC 2161]
MSKPSIAAYPLGSYEAHSLPGANVLMVWKVVPNEAALQTGERLTIPMAMTAAQAREVGEMLLRTAVATEMGQAPSTSMN